MVRWVVRSILHGVDPFASTPPATTGTQDSTYTDRVFSIYVRSWCDGSSDRSFMGWTPSLAHHQLQQVPETALTLTDVLVFTFVHGAIGRRIDPSWGGPLR